MNRNHSYVFAYYIYMEILFSSNYVWYNTDQELVTSDRSEMFDI